MALRAAGLLTELSPAEKARAAQSTLTLDHHFDTENHILAITPPLTASAVELTQRQRLRGYDAVQVAAALTIRIPMTTRSRTFDPRSHAKSHND